MCGIAGLFDGSAHDSFSRELLGRMADAIAHRGPDGHGFHLEPGLALAHRRLAVIDVAAGHQPMFSSDRNAVVVFNGEIYNFRELTAELKTLGHVFKTQSDTEVILNAWQAWGAACVKRFSGMFAFALWDVRSETLVLARDHLGKKPLYYAITGGRRLAFASELKGLLPCPWISRRILPEAIEDYLCLGYVPDPKSIYRDVLKLPPGHLLLWQRGNAPVLMSYWDLDLSSKPAQSISAAAEELGARLQHAVRQRLVSEVPLGAFLSGGVDSSGIVAHMALAENAPVKTCTIGFGEGSHDERPYARALAQRYATDHVEKTIAPDFMSTMPGLLDRVAAAYDEPFADNSAIPTYLVCAAAREHVTVALSGDGGDEAFGGYRRYRWHMREQAVRAVIPDWLRGPAFGTMARFYPQLAWAPRFLRARTTLRELSQSATSAYLSNVSVVPDELRHQLYEPRFASELQGYHASTVIRGLMEAAPADNPLLQAQYVDMKTWLAGRMLVKVDRASMAHGLEVRSPYLDHELFQWAVSLPASLKVHGSQQKVVLKAALEPVVQHELLYRSKQGFGMPIAAWLRNTLRPEIERALTSPILLEAGFFRREALRRLMDEHASGQRDHGAVLWSLLMLERFLAREAGLAHEAATSGDIAHNRWAKEIGDRQRQALP